MGSSVKFTVILKAKTHDFKEISRQWQPLLAAPRPASGFVLSSHFGIFLAGALLCYLFSHCMGCFIGIVALIDKVTNLLTVHHEVNSICSEDQEAVISMM